MANSNQSESADTSADQPAAVPDDSDLLENISSDSLVIDGLEPNSNVSLDEVSNDMVVNDSNQGGGTPAVAAAGGGGGVELMDIVDDQADTQPLPPCGDPLSPPLFKNFEEAIKVEGGLKLLAKPIKFHQVCSFESPEMEVISPQNNILCEGQPVFDMGEEDPSHVAIEVVENEGLCAHFHSFILIVSFYFPCCCCC